MYNKLIIFMGMILATSSQCQNTPNFVLKALHSASHKVGVPHILLDSICRVESHLNPNAHNPEDGQEASYGLCQVKPSTIRVYGFKDKPEKLYNPFTNAYYAARYLKTLLKRYDNNWYYAIAAYNYGSVKLNKKKQVVNRKYVFKVKKNIFKQTDMIVSDEAWEKIFIED